MATFKYVGTPAQWDVQPQHGSDLVDVDYLNFLLSQNLGLTAVNAQIASLLSQYATASYASTAMASLATPAYVATQNGAYIPLTLVGQKGGPVPLDAAGHVAVGLINVPSTQQWPSPYVSPNSYGSLASGGAVASTAPVQLYTCPVADPGYPYRLMCLGLVDGMVALDNSTMPEILVNQGSTSGPTIAFGYGLGQFYQGSTPGQFSSQAFLGLSQKATGGWTTLTGWTAVNSPSFITTLNGPYLQATQSMQNANVIASFAFSGAYSGDPLFNVTTQIRIIAGDGTVLATSPGQTGGNNASYGGTCVATALGVTITAGELITVQGRMTNVQPGAFGIGVGTYGRWSSGPTNALTVTPPLVTNQAPINLIPTPFDGQSTLTGPTTLYVSLQSSDSLDAVTATNFAPSLWVCPIPWT